MFWGKFTEIDGVFREYSQKILYIPVKFPFPGNPRRSGHPVNSRKSSGKNTNVYGIPKELVPNIPVIPVTKTMCLPDRFAGIGLVNSCSFPEFFWELMGFYGN